MKKLSIIFISMLFSGCTTRPSGMPETEGNQCFNMLYKAYAPMTKYYKRPGYRMIPLPRMPEDVEMCSMSFSGSGEAYFLYDKKNNIGWHKFFGNGMSMGISSISEMLMSSRSQWIKNEAEKLCATDASCMKKKAEEQKALEMREAKLQKVWEEQKSAAVKQCQLYTKMVYRDIPLSSNARVLGASKLHPHFLNCSIYFEQETIYGKRPNSVSLMINTSNGVFEYQ